MEQDDIRLLVDWLEQNKDHRLNIIEKEAVKLAIMRSKTVGDLVQTALDMLKKA